MTNCVYTNGGNPYNKGKIEIKEIKMRKAKLSEFKFRRNPDFTPALADEQLTQIEETVRNFAQAMLDDGYMKGGAEKFDLLQLACDMHNGYLELHGYAARPECLELDSKDNDAAWIYARNCYNFLVVCGSKRGLWFLRAAATSRTYAYKMGYLG
jgi:hypothetical protein